LPTLTSKDVDRPNKGKESTSSGTRRQEEGLVLLGDKVSRSGVSLNEALDEKVART